MASLTEMSTRLLELDADRFEVENTYADWIEEMNVEFLRVANKTSPENAAFFAGIVSCLDSRFTTRLEEIADETRRLEDLCEIVAARDRALEANPSILAQEATRRYYAEMLAG